MKDDSQNKSNSNGNADRDSSAFSAPNSNQTQNNAELPTINLPKGGGAIRGIEEKFQVNSVTGTSGFGIPIPLAPSRHGFVPAIGLNYNSGGGNSPFGLGWNLEIPRITRKTENLLPIYRDADESDTFILSGAEDLVPLLEKDGANWKRYERQKTENGVSYTVRRYRPRIEGLFAVIEKWKNNNSGETHWRTITRDNVHSYFGTTPESRLSDPHDASKVFEWKLCRTHNDKGSICIYEYKAEDFNGIPNRANEKNRINNCSQNYLKKIFYGNRQPFYLGDALPTEDDFLFKVVFDYGEHDTAENVPQDIDAEKNVWTCRQDAFSSYRAGFEIRTYRRCRRVLLFHCFDQPELPHNPYLVSSLQFFYDDDLDLNGDKINGFSFLTKARQNGHLWNAAANSYSTKFLPEIEFTYQPHEWNTTVQTVADENIFNAPSGIGDRRYLWIDLFGEGVAGILTEQANGWFYKSNLGDGNFSPAQIVSPKPSFQGLSGGATAIAELAGDGAKYLVQSAAEPRGFFKLTEENEWQSFKNFESFPNLDANDANTRPIDLDGDGIAELLVTEADKLRWYRGIGEKGFAVSQTTAKEIDEEKGPAIVFADRAQSIFLADLNGDGLTDIVRIRNGEICYWANLGYGKFSAKILMDNSPQFDHPDQFNPANLRLADVDGSGTIDVIYLGKNDFRVWLNLNGNEWTIEPQIIHAFPEINDLADVSVLDFTGNGTACLVYSSSAPNRQTAPLQYIDLMNGVKPHLLVKYENNCGKEVSIEYKSSTKFYLEDKKTGKNWITKLPFPVHCISKVRSEDLIRETVFTSSYRYAHGYFDRAEKEFRGFARVEQLDTEEFSQFKLNAAKNVVEEQFHQPPVRTVSWFHTGAFLSKERILHQCRSEYFHNEDFEEYELPEPKLAEDFPAEELSEAFRAVKGMLLRSEVYAEDDTDLSGKPYSAAQSSVEIRRIQPKDANKYAVFQVVPNESISYGYERNPADPRISHSFVLETDELGNIEKAASVIYPRISRPIGANAVPDRVWNEQNRRHVVYSEAVYTNDVVDDDERVYRLRVACESKSYEIGGVVPQSNEFYFRKTDLITEIAACAEILYETDFDGSKQKRLSAHGRTYFLNDDLAAPLALGELSALGIGHRGFQLAFTENLVTKLYGAKVSDQMLADAKYVHSEGDEHWWTQSGTLVYAADPKTNFYTPIGSRDVYGNENSVEYDEFTLLVKSATDAIGNRTSAEHDYRTLAPVLMTDLNLNRAAVETDELGMVVKSAVMGKVGEGEGDTLTDPTVRLEYDLFNWKNNRKPNFAHSFAREKHGAANPRWQESYVYSDGGGGVIMAKTQAEPGKALRWNAATKQLDEVDANPRWVGNGRTIINNKGNSIKQFEPFFSTTHEYENEDALVETGITPLMFYDPVGRNIRTELPNGTFTKIEFDAWFIKSYDMNDTVKESVWYAERGSPKPDLDPEPTDAERRAAWLAAKHAATPQTVYTNSRGNPFFSVSDHGNGKTTHAFSENDLFARFSFAFDQKDRKVSETLSNMLGATVYAKSAEKGEQWVLTDVIGRLVKTWDNDLREFRTTYDALHRPVSGFVKEGANEFLINHILYADYFFNESAAQNLNLKGRAFRLYDQSGSVTFKQADFKGNVLTVERRLISDYKARIIDWSNLDGLTTLVAIETAANPMLETETFIGSGEVDALNRPTLIVSPDGSISQPIYNEANLLDSLQVKLRGNGDFITFLEEQNYDAKGQRQFAKYGNGTITEYFYDPKTYRLTNLLTRLSGGGGGAQAIQNLFYTFDPVGNITQIRDAAQQTHYFANAVVTAENKYEYDAAYQLKKATGREHAGLGGNAQRESFDLPFIAQLPHTNDATAVRRYEEQYEYDDCGNITRLRHLAVNANWTKRYRYEYEDNAANNTNRLKATSDAGDADGVFSLNYFHDSHGNMTAMPHLSAADSLVWNFIDQLKEVNLGGGGTAYYVYGASGNRLRKVVERQGGLIQERIYLGGVEIYRERQGNAAVHLERETVHISDDTGRIAQVDTKTIDTNGSDPANPLGVSLIRYQYANHLGSAVLETDNNGQIISYEEYHPFGTSAYRVSKSASDFSLKRYRFSGKERDDETGFYYFGARYYAAWLGRWTSSDPAGFVDGANLFRYCQNNPVKLRDPNGTQPTDRRFGLPDYSNLGDNPTQAQINDAAGRLQGYVYGLGYRWSRDGAENPNPTYDSSTHNWSFGTFDPDFIPADDPLRILGDAPPPTTSDDLDAGVSRSGDGGTGGASPTDAGSEPLPGGIADGGVSGEGGAPNVGNDGAEGGGPGEVGPDYDSGGSGDSYVGEPGFWESLIPIWGSGRESINHFQHGNYVRGTFWGVMAVLDIFLVKALVVGAGRLLFRTGVSALAHTGETVVARGAVEGLERAPSLVVSQADNLVARAGEAEFKALGPRFGPGAQLVELDGWFVKRVDPTSSLFRQHWGRMSIEAQEQGLLRLGPEMSTEFFMRDGMLFTRSVGETGPRVFSSTFGNGFFRGSYRMGTILNDIRPRNMGVNGLIFDPALDPFMKSLVISGTYGTFRVESSVIDDQIP